MNHYTRRSRAVIALGMAGMLTLAGCGGGDEETASSGDASQTEAMATDGPDAAGETVEVTGVEYEFEGLPATMSSGTELTFTNGGEEAHELVLLKIADDEERSAQELLALPQEEAQTLTQMKGVAVAPPGGDGRVVEGALVVDEPGRYMAICFIPVGTTEMPEGPPEEGEAPGGPPHFTRGMFAEVSVE